MCKACFQKPEVYRLEPRSRREPSAQACGSHIDQELKAPARFSIGVVTCLGVTESMSIFSRYSSLRANEKKWSKDFQALYKVLHGLGTKPAILEILIIADLFVRVDSLLISIYVMCVIACTFNARRLSILDLSIV